MPSHLTGYLVSLQAITISKPRTDRRRQHPQLTTHFGDDGGCGGGGVVVHLPLSNSRSSANDFCTCSGVSRSSRSASALVSAHSLDVSRLKALIIFMDGFLQSSSDNFFDDKLAFNIVDLALPTIKLKTGLREIALCLRRERYYLCGDTREVCDWVVHRRNYYWTSKARDDTIYMYRIGTSVATPLQRMGRYIIILVSAVHLNWLHWSYRFLTNFRYVCR